jgi:hypothetical protein
VSASFDAGFAVFLVLMAGLLVAVVRFAVSQGRRRPPPSPPSTAGSASGPELDETSAAGFEDDSDEGGDS